MNDADEWVYCTVLLWYRWGLANRLSVCVDNSKHIYLFKHSWIIDSEKDEEEYGWKGVDDMMINMNYSTYR